MPGCPAAAGNSTSGFSRCRAHSRERRRQGLFLSLVERTPNDRATRAMQCGEHFVGRHLALVRQEQGRITDSSVLSTCLIKASLMPRSDQLASECAGSSRPAASSGMSRESRSDTGRPNLSGTCLFASRRQTNQAADAGATEATGIGRVVRMISFSASTMRKNTRPPTNSHGQTQSGIAAVSKRV